MLKVCHQCQNPDQDHQVIQNRDLPATAFHWENLFRFRLLEMKDLETFWSQVSTSWQLQVCLCSDMDQFPAFIPAQDHQNGLGNGNWNPVKVTAQEQQESMLVNLASHSYAVATASVTPTASLRGPTIINFPLPPICFTEADRM